MEAEAGLFILKEEGAISIPRSDLRVGVVSEDDKT